jgi:hypothetical protein
MAFVICFYTRTRARIMRIYRIVNAFMSSTNCTIVVLKLNLALALKHRAATSYDSSSDMPSRFTPQNSRLSQRAPLKSVSVLFSRSCPNLNHRNSFDPSSIKTLNLFYFAFAHCPFTTTTNAAVCRQIALALFLFICGIVLLTIGELHAIACC